VVILASNLKGNIDEAFSRPAFKFHGLLSPVPGPEERATTLGPEHSRASCASNPSVDLARIAEEFEISGGAKLVNVPALISRLATPPPCGRDAIRMEDIRQGIRREISQRWKRVI